jgi:hypothetical protein
VNMHVLLTEDAVDLFADEGGTIVGRQQDSDTWQGHGYPSSFPGAVSRRRSLVGEALLSVSGKPVTRKAAAAPHLFSDCSGAVWCCELTGESRTRLL